MKTLLFALALVGVARGDTIYLPVYFNASPPTGAANEDLLINFQQFDPSLGTLTGVHPSMTANIGYGVNVKALPDYNPNSGNIFSWTERIDLMFLGPGGNNILTDTLLSGGNNIYAPGQTAISNNSMLVYAPSFTPIVTWTNGLDAFIGSGTWEGDVRSTFSNIRVNLPPGVVISGVDYVFENLRVNISYDYTPAVGPITATPEPSFCGLIGAAFGGIIWRLRRSKISGTA